MLDGILEKLSSYQVASSLIPGAAFVTALSWLGVYSVGDRNFGELAVIYYVVGLILNRVGAISAFGFGRDKVKALYKVYERGGQGPNVYDTYVLYRTLATAMFLLVIVAVLHVIPPIGVGSFTQKLLLAAIAGLVFTGATIMQMRHLDHLIQETGQGRTPVDAGTPVAGS